MVRLSRSVSLWLADVFKPGSIAVHLPQCNGPTWLYTGSYEQAYHHPCKGLFQSFFITTTNIVR